LALNEDWYWYVFEVLLPYLFPNKIDAVFLFFKMTVLIAFTNVWMDFLYLLWKEDNKSQQGVLE
jgi:hypothetical protein